MLRPSSFNVAVQSLKKEQTKEGSDSSVQTRKKQNQNDSVGHTHKPASCELSHGYADALTARYIGTPYLYRTFLHARHHLTYKDSTNTWAREAVTTHDTSSIVGLERQSHAVMVRPIPCTTVKLHVRRPAHALRDSTRMSKRSMLRVLSYSDARLSP